MYISQEVSFHSKVPPKKSRMPRRSDGEAYVRTNRKVLSDVLQSIKSFDDCRVGHAHAFAHGLQTVTAASALELMHHRDHEASTGRAKRVTKRNRSTEWIQFLRISACLFQPGEWNRSECFVHFKDVDIIDRQAGAF